MINGGLDQPAGRWSRAREAVIGPMSWNHVYLLIAVGFEVIATTALKSTDGFTRLWPSLISVGGYALAFYFLSLTLRVIPVGVVYALWSGLGIVFIVGIARVAYGQALDAPAMLGLALIVLGVAIIHLFSKSIPH